MIDDHEDAFCLENNTVRQCTIIKGQKILMLFQDKISVEDFSEVPLFGLTRCLDLTVLR